VKILIISNMFPPYIMGGAEMAAHSLALWLAGEGHTVHVLTSAHRRELVGTKTMAENLTVERYYFASPYQIYQAQPQQAVMKAAWHAHDHFHFTSEGIAAEVIERFQPDIINTHSLQGIGYNLLRAVARSGVPCVQTLHDFGFLCINVNRFKDGQECDRHHLPCQFSTRIKRSYLSEIPRLAFWSPSQALLEAFGPHLPPSAQAVAIPLPLTFEQPSLEPCMSDRPIRLLYVGQVTPWKGVAFLLEVVMRLTGERPFQLHVIGDGSDLSMLREKYPGSSGIVFHGKLPPEEVGGHMAKADLLLTPSLWFENAPLVISQAIRMGLPVFASRIGGLPELVDDLVSGRLLAAGDAAAWSAALKEVLDQPQLLAKWRAGAAELQPRFSVDALGTRVLDLFHQTLSPTRSSASLAEC
jgi:glycosyltransferase involved in cell wall biosynthesis